MGTWSTEHRIELRGTADEALEALTEAADVWGAEWRRQGLGGELAIPVSAGLRHGHLRGEVSTRQISDRVELTFCVEDSHYKLHVQAFVVLLMGAVGGLSLVVVPFYPPLIALAPAAILLSLAAWFLVASKVKTRGPDDFLQLLEEIREECR